MGYVQSDMTMAQTDVPTPQKPLRLWPGVVLTMILCLTWFVLPTVMPNQGMYWFFGTFIGALATFVWWAFFSRAPRFERWGAIALTILALYGTSLILHVSVAQAGMGMMFVFYSIPLLSIAFGVAVVASHRLAAPARRAVIAVTILLAIGGWALVRTDGIWAEGGLDFAWRWSATHEERLLAQTKDEPMLLPAAPAAAEPAMEPPRAGAAEEQTEPPPAPAAAETVAAWPGFRGPDRSSIIRGVRIETE